MNKTIKIYIGLLLLLFAGAIAIEFSKPKPINWTRTFNEKHKIPYGTLILYKELESLFPKSKIHDITVTPYEYFDELYDWEESNYSTSGTYIYIDDFADIDDVSAQELLDFSTYGNDIFISSNYLPKKFKDSLFFENTLPEKLSSELRSLTNHSELNFCCERHFVKFFFENED